MPTLVWDKVGDRAYESGLDKGVLYLPDGSAVPWNGLTSVIEKFDKEASAVYFDGMKIQDLVVLGDFSATMKALTYPDEFVELEGVGELRPGVYVSDQFPGVFGLAYRTQIGNDLDGETGYKIHLLWNVTAIPHDKTYASVSNDPSLVEFEWDLVAVPEEVAGMRPTAHFVINSNDIDPWLLEDIEKQLYGTLGVDASLIPISELVTFMNEWYRVKITDNGDGTWTAEAQRDGIISYLDGGAESIFQIAQANVIFLDDVTYLISDTFDASEIPQIAISVDISTGIWTATTDSDALITVNPDGTFEILNANVTPIDADTYRLADTTSED